LFRFIAEYPAGREVLYHGDRAISEEVLTGHTLIGHTALNGSGQILWSGKGKEFGGTYITFLDTHPVSYEVLGPGRSTNAATCCGAV